MREPTDKYVTLQRKNQTATEEISRRIRERLKAFEEENEDCLRDSEPSEDLRTSLTVDSTLAKLHRGESSKAAQLRAALEASHLDG